jgi:hypothetical protein
MFSVIACAICGGDPATDTMIVNAAVAGAISMPWLFRDRIVAVARRLRGSPDTPAELCAIAPDEDDGPSAR